MAVYKVSAFDSSIEAMQLARGKATRDVTVSRFAGEVLLCRNAEPGARGRHVRDAQGTRR